MPRLILPTYTVIRDTREQSGHGWTFDAHVSGRRPPLCEGTITDTLQTGDYSMVGYTDIVTIERKADFSELWGNYSSKKRPAFEAEMERMSKIKHPYIIVESLFTPDIMELSPPQFTKGVPGKSFVRWLMYLSAKFGVHIIPAGACGRKIAQMILEEVVRVERDRWVYQEAKPPPEVDKLGF
ncbi:ERCC4 domain-containing protein [Candidatus Pacearchaeota archaeon]|nr:ERCC4 domain-containing protein [Candidatus Pacearchaeota archaeon]